MGKIIILYLNKMCIIIQCTSMLFVYFNSFFVESSMNIDSGQIKLFQGSILNMILLGIGD